MNEIHLKSLKSFRFQTNQFATCHQMDKFWYRTVKTTETVDRELINSKKVAASLRDKTLEKFWDSIKRRHAQ